MIVKKNIFEKLAFFAYLAPPVGGNVKVIYFTFRFLLSKRCLKLKMTTIGLVGLNMF